MGRDAASRAVLLESIMPKGKVSMAGLFFTPFLRDGDVFPAVNIAAVAGLADLARKVGIDIVLLGGTTDEWASLSVDERIALARAWRAAVPAGSQPKLLFHTGSNCVAEAQRLAATAVELKCDAILASAPVVFRAPDLKTHCETVAAALAPVEGTDMPVLYYHFPGVYNDDFELLPLLSTLVEVCPNVVGAKLAGVGDMKLVEAASAMESFGVLGTGLPMLSTHPSGWVCYPWEAPSARVFVADNVTDTSPDASVLGTLRSEVVSRRPTIRAGAYQMSADKAFMTAWGGTDVGDCRLPLPSMSVESMTPVAASLVQRGLLDT